MSILRLQASGLLAGLALFASACGAGAEPLRLIEPNVKDAAIAGPVRFITTAGFAPFNDADGRNRASGFNVELARAVCEARDLVCSVQIVPWEQIERRLRFGLADAAIAGHSASAAGDGISITSPYLTNPGRFVVRVGETLSSTASVGVAPGAAADYLAQHARETVQFEDLDAAWAALAAGEIGAVFTTAIPGAAWLGTPAGACCEFAPGVYHEPDVFGEGMVILATDKALAAGLTSAMDELYETGRFAELYFRFFPNGLY